MKMQDQNTKWEDILSNQLDKLGIAHEKTSFAISSNIKKLRDYDWEKILQSGQIVEVLYPKRQGSKLRIKAFDLNDLPIEIGTVSFYNNNIIYPKAIIGQLTDKELHYTNGDKRTCLEFNQPIVLVDSDSIPQELLELKTLNLKKRGEKSTPTGCGLVIILVAIIIMAALFIYLFL